MLDENYLRMIDSFLDEEISLIGRTNDIEENSQVKNSQKELSNEGKRKLKTIEAPAKRMKIDTSLCDMS
jgi:hypothetical protein